MKKALAIIGGLSASHVLTIFFTMTIVTAGFTAYNLYLDALPHTVTYTIESDGAGNYRTVKYNGQVLWTSTNASYTINQALNSLTTGRTWKEKIVIKGNISLTNAILVPSYTIVQTIGKLHVTASAEGDHSVIANKDPANGNTEIEIIGGFLSADISGDAWGSAVTFDKVTNGKILYTEINWTSGDEAIYVRDSENIEIAFNKITSYAHGGPWTQRMKNSSIHDNYFLAIGGSYEAITISDGDFNRIENNYIKNNSSVAAINIATDSDNNIIKGNVIDAQSYSLAIGSSNCENNLVIENQFLTTGINILLGTGNIVKFNQGYITENSGTFSSISNGTYISHGLAGTPDIVTITLSVQGYAWLGASNSTHFQIYANVATISGNWYAEYKP